jgi:DNA repair exonuclease SbcCD ATPase subunit/DNA-directed RNA polymerase subunit RPC12/RpoP
MVLAPVMERLPPGTARCLRCQRLHDIDACKLPARDGSVADLMQIEGMTTVRLRCPHCGTTYEFLHSVPTQKPVAPPPLPPNEHQHWFEEQRRKFEDEIVRLRAAIDERIRREEEELARRKREIEEKRKRDEEELHRRERELKQRREEQLRQEQEEAERHRFDLQDKALRLEEDHRRTVEAVQQHKERERLQHGEVELRRHLEERTEAEKKHVLAVQKRSLELLQRMQTEEEALKRTVIQLTGPEEFKFACLYCGHHLQARFDMAGASVECPACHRKSHVPERGMAGALN